MSAILGRINIDGAPIFEESFHHAFELIAHYGGDGSNTSILGSVALGQHLLRFTPESRHEQQPYTWDDAIVVADVRLDNRDELCDRFGLSHEEKTLTPDSHLILRAYRFWENDCTAHLLGDYAFAIWDLRGKQLLCARDHIGVRPFYYYHTSSTFVFATDIRALQAFPDVNCEIDELEVASYLTWQRGSERTFFKHIQVLQPGRQLIVTADGLKHQVHWSPDNAPDVRYKVISEYKEHFRSLLEAAVAARVRTPYPVAAHISGGLDSSGVAVLANRQLRKHGRSLDMTYTWSPPKSEIYPPVQRDERNTIEAICLQENVPCHYSTATGQDLRNFLARDMATELTADVYEELPVLAHAQELGIRTIISGWGGDEAATFAGRGYMAYLLKRGHLLELARITWRAVGVRRIGRTPRYLFRHVVTPLLPDLLYERIDPYYRSDRRPQYTDAAFAARYPQVATFRRASWRETSDPRRMQMSLLQDGHLTERMATWAVWSSTHQVVHTYPLTDRRVLEFALGLPPAMLYQQGTTRYLYRDSMKDLLPRMPPKADPVNQHKRDNSMLACWRILADEVNAGQWSRHDVPWLDLGHLRERLRAVPNEMTSNQLLEFVPLIAPVRIWHLWRHHGDTVGR